jgi:hypothetical protein
VVGPVCGGVPPDRLAEAVAAAQQLVAAGLQVSRRSLRGAGRHGSRADLGVLARVARSRLTASGLAASLTRQSYSVTCQRTKSPLSPPRAERPRERAILMNRRGGYRARSLTAATRRAFAAMVRAGLRAAEEGKQALSTTHRLSTS